MRAVIDRLLRRTWKGGLISREFLHRSIDFGPGFIPNSCYTNFLPLIKVTQMERLLTKFLQNFQQRNSLYWGNTGVVGLVLKTFAKSSNSFLP